MSAMTIEQKVFNGYDFMLCQDCLCIREYTEDRNEGLERCSCGGEFCCCEQCAHVLNLLIAGLLTPELYNEFFQEDSVLDLSSWNPETGVLTGQVKK